MPKGGPRPNSGRKSAYVEKADAERLFKMYFEHVNQEEIEARIRSGKFSIMDRHMLNAMEGDQKAITPLFQKLFPDKLEVEDETTLKLDI